MPALDIQSLRISSRELERTNVDLFGVDEQKRDLMTSARFILSDNNKEIIDKLEIRNNILLCGKPGVGKTRSVFWLSNELKKKYRNLDLYYAKLGSILSENLGESSRNIESLFTGLREKVANGTIIILFVDEIDSIGVSRWNTLENDGIRRTMSSLFMELDSNVNTPNFLFFAATNRYDLLDSALIRRFSRTIRYPEVMGKEAFGEFYRHIFDLELRGPELDELFSIIESNMLTPSDIKEALRSAYMDTSDFPKDFDKSAKKALSERISPSKHEELEKSTFRRK